MFIPENLFPVLDLLLKKNWFSSFSLAPPAQKPPENHICKITLSTSLCVIQQVRHLYPPPAIPFCCTSNATPPLHREPPLLKEWNFFYSPGWSCNALLFQIIKIVIIKKVITTNHYTWFEKRGCGSIILLNEKSPSFLRQYLF